MDIEKTIKKGPKIQDNLDLETGHFKAKNRVTILHFEMLLLKITSEKKRFPALHFTPRRNW